MNITCKVECPNCNSDNETNELVFRFDTTNAKEQEDYDIVECESCKRKYKIRIKMIVEEY